jgi:hypothetical protein
MGVHWGEGRGINFSITKREKINCIVSKAAWLNIFSNFNGSRNIIENAPTAKSTKPEHKNAGN